ncbi:TPA_asm: PAP2 family protein [Salmonella enterica subsp. enterica serovar Typhimurium]|uniref:PAP2 family protein n=2 Tax=Enterobacterales TaxID=91347 RepID=A0A732YIB5_SALTM|nr:PAP2 family protein [Escherichia coli]HAE5428402.1 PAP2 family protein [Salmonella enterica subsp. enterica serovar Typhimurium]MDN2246903.1 PAP2 family protein [Escherichia coli]QEF70741.1 PAP2 family protein [Escherichia coli]WPB10359.1 PAP2 family protein [Escherichia coli]HAE5431733.1 PAP2 family protein [Salmonella enterica subsp. enterica serovar Typhimurium]
MGGGVGFVMPYLSNKRLLAEMSIALVMAIVATLTLEHSQIDLMVADWFYLGMGHWMVAKQAFLPDLLLYSGLKKLLMAMLIYLLVATICRAYHEKKGNAITAKWLVPVTKFRVRELAYLVLTLILVPTVVASLKAYTHVVCPVHLTIFDGTLPYLPMLDSMRNTIPDKCFPAAHASSGFALFAFAFAPSLRRRRGAIIIVVMALGWAMGCYKMIIGDHFLSHTVVSMMLAWAMSAGLAWVFFKKGEQVSHSSCEAHDQSTESSISPLSVGVPVSNLCSLSKVRPMFLGKTTSLTVACWPSSRTIATGEEKRSPARALGITILALGGTAGGTANPARCWPVGICPGFNTREDRFSSSLCAGLSNS